MDLRAHDLLRLDPHDLEIPDNAPAWAARELTRHRPWVVVRRAVAAPGMAAVGVRGAARRERWAFSVPLSCVRDRTAPEALVGERRLGTVGRTRRTLPAYAALEAAAGLLDGCGLVWGPGGSVGYELASGLPAVTENSDLDLILRCPGPMPRADAGRIVRDLGSLPARVDARLDTGTGSIVLAEWAGGGRVLLRRPEGPILTEDPWSEPETSHCAADAPFGRVGR